jgi:hypothetical protein
MKRILLVPLFLAIALSAGCSKKEAPPPAQSTRVSATSAYEKYFGPAPTSDKGSCFAFVIYFPSAKEPGRVVPFPFFTFDEASTRKIAVERLLGGMKIGSYKGEFLQPFPVGTSVVATAEAQGTVTLTLSREFGAIAHDKVGESGVRALVLTLRQFKGVSAVRVKVEGVDTPLEVQADDSNILPPGPPRLLSVTAMKDRGAKEVEEVNAFFDRPVDIRELHLSTQDGRPFAGDTYHAVFDMAAVLKPKAPSLFTAGMMVRVRWKVADKLGHEAEGDEVVPLEVKVHEQ